MLDAEKLLKIFKDMPEEGIASESDGIRITRNYWFVSIYVEHSGITYSFQNEDLERMIATLRILFWLYRANNDAWQIRKRREFNAFYRKIWGTRSY